MSAQVLAIVILSRTEKRICEKLHADLGNVLLGTHYLFNVCKSLFVDDQA